MSRKNMYIDLNQMDQAIEKLKVIRDLLKEIRSLQTENPPKMDPIPPGWTTPFPYMPTPPATPLPYIPPSPTTVPQWVDPTKITCKEGEASNGSIV